MSRNSSKKDLGVFPHAELPPPVAAVIEAIETDIIRGIILPSTRLIEDHLMEDYDAKRHVVRAALVELQRLGVVVKPPHVGARIRRFDAASLEALYHFRSVLHRAAVEAMPLPVSPERLQAVRDASAAHAEAAQSGDLIAIHRANMAFHRLFFGLCDNPYIEESIRLHDWLSFPARAYAITDQSALSRACEEHEQMVDAIARCDREALMQLALGHMLQARRIYEGKYLSR
ncbi:GntR family transcriptional regulator [Diaphorobacter sp. HDW4B]|uniref:GntR family transcriptional regulator n=1 Tax=Diaphorobacter sp. HDW4B TaxID=2714925 RepID=UPI00140C4ABE|nr:GntR family transcriptional regulator [Diaphorobacter sp. HDW4B]QIL70747.1 GntR family transcriptional regulator [Diaphorobacter sp. HDW4B]